MQNTPIAKDDFKYSIEEHRNKVSLLQPAVSEPIDYQQNFSIKMSADYSLLLSIYRPENISAPYPTIFYIPGTAFVADEFAFTALICSHIAKQSHCQVIVLRHRLAPEYPFPAGLSDIAHLIQGIIQYAETFGIDRNQMVMMGYSSGGNFSATLTADLQATLKFQRQVLICPMLDLSRNLNAYKNEFENQDNVIKDNFVGWFLKLYLPKTNSPKHPLISPSWQTSEKVKHCPPTDIIFGEYDRFRSDAEHYYLKLCQAQVIAFRLMIDHADHAFLWFQLHVAQAIGARIKVALGLESVPRPLMDTHFAFFIRMQKIHAKKRLTKDTTNNLAVIPYKKL